MKTNKQRMAELEGLVREYMQLSQNGMVICLDTTRNLRCSHFSECPGGRGGCALVKAARDLGIEGGI